VVGERAALRLASRGRSLGLDVLYDGAKPLQRGKEGDDVGGVGAEAGVVLRAPAAVGG